MKINYPWLRPEPRIFLFRDSSPGDTAVLHKARASRHRVAFDGLVDVLASVSGRLRYRRLLRDLANDVRVRRTPRIVGVAR